jgi:hypothetical protein
MNANLTSILEYKTSKVEVDKLKFLDVLNKELLKFNFEEDYLKEGTPTIENASEVTFYTCLIENFTDTRSMSESNRPNRSGVPMGNKRFSEFNIWDYKLSYKKEFNNSSDSHDITESHHAIGCGTCKQQGKIRCSSCRGAGDVTCSSCSGRGQKQCSNCNGRVDIKCWSCSGKGTKETGYGENKRTERCSSCSGRGSNKCTICSNGFITCSTCSGRGKVTCYTCNGSGEVTCYQCDGYRTMDHYFIVTASFVNLSQSLFLTNSYPGFDQNKSQINNFNIQNKIFDICENKFKQGYFEEIKTSPFYSQITSFFDFTNNESSKLIKSRINFFENKYSEVTFSFYGEKYILYFDKNLDQSYYGGKKPSDQYELDLLKKAIQSSVKNELSVTKKTIQKLAKYDFISISEKEIISAIEDTENIYEAHNEYKSKNYSSAESTLRLVSVQKKSELDYIKLFKQLNKIYFINTTIFGIVGFASVYYKLLDKDSQFTLWNILIAIGIISICWLVNRASRSIHWARLFVLVLFSIQFSGIIYFENKEGNSIRSQNALEDTYINFKNSNYTVYNGQDSIILIEPTGVERRNYYLPKGKPFILDIGGGQRTSERIAEGQMYLDIERQAFENARGSYQVTVALKSNNSGFRFDIIANYDDIIFREDDNDVELRYTKNSIEYYKLNNTSTTFISKSAWESIKKGSKTIESTIENIGSLKEPQSMEEDYSNSEQTDLIASEITTSDARTLYNRFSNAIINENLNKLFDCLAPTLTVWYAKANIQREQAIADWESEYASKWSVVSDEINDLSAGDRTGEFIYFKNYIIRSKTKPDDERTYEISGYFVVDFNGQIIEMKDLETNRLQNK